MNKVYALSKTFAGLRNCESCNPEIKIVYIYTNDVAATEKISVPLLARTSIREPLNKSSVRGELVEP